MMHWLKRAALGVIGYGSQLEQEPSERKTPVLNTVLFYTNLSFRYEAYLHRYH